jgi:PDZ domain/Aspartyl protease
MCDGVPMRWPVTLTAITLLVATLVSAQASSAPPPSYQFSSDGASLQIPVEIVAGGLVFVQAKVNDHPGWFIVDNGTQGFVVDRDYARHNSLQSSGSAVTREVGSDARQAGMVQDVHISLPGLELTHRNLVLIELKSVEPAVGHAVDGIIGSRLFDDFVVVVDYEHHWLSVYAPNNYRPTGSEKVLPVRVDQHGFQYIDASIALPGAAPVAGSFLIDGGANYYANIYKPFSDAHHIPPSTMKLLVEPGMSPSRDGRADRIDIRPYSVKNPPITFAQDTEGLMAAKDYPGLVGAKFLERFTVVFDSPGKRILLTPNGSYGTPAEYDESGLRIRAEDPGFHKFVVGRVLPSSPAAEAGIEPGDIIESLDARSAQDMTLTQLRSMLSRPKARYSVGILRGNSRLRIDLQLRPLL